MATSGAVLGLHLFIWVYLHVVILDRRPCSARHSHFFTAKINVAGHGMSNIRFSIISCLLLIAFTETVSLYIDGNIFRSRFVHGGFMMPSDLLCFRDNALLLIHPSPELRAATAAQAPYMYPPPFMLLNVPLARFSPFGEFCAWTVLSNALLILAGFCAGMSWRGIALGLIMPANLYCTVIAETGAIVSSLLAVSLALAETQPIFAGIAAGALVIKPQFALLLPFCFLASRNFRALGAAIATVLVLGTLTTLIFGPAIWAQFITTEIPLSTKVLAEPWPHPVWTIMVSVFFTMRSLGAGLHLSYAVQAIATLAAIFAAWRLWRRPTPDPLARLATTLGLAVLATPYVLTYDLAALSLILAGYFLSAKTRRLPVFAGFWFCSGLYVFFSIILSAGGILIPLLLAKIWPKSAAPTCHEQSLTPGSNKLG
jgi:hypothetical protein